MYVASRVVWLSWLFVFQAEDGIRDLVRSRGLGDVYKRQFEAFARMEEKIEQNERMIKASSEIDEEFSGDRLQLSLIHI